MIGLGEVVCLFNVIKILIVCRHAHANFIADAALEAADPEIVKSGDLSGTFGEGLSGLAKGLIH